MRIVLNQVPINGRIVIGEGEIDEAPMLYIGEAVGTGVGAVVDIAVDPIEGTRMTALGQANALTVLAVAEKGAFLHAPDICTWKNWWSGRRRGAPSISPPRWRIIYARWLAVWEKPCRN